MTDLRVLLQGRKPAFNGTLLLASVFGCALGFANSFPALCALVVCLGAGIGGSMPTDVSTVNTALLYFPI